MPLGSSSWLTAVLTSWALFVGEWESKCDERRSLTHMWCRRMTLLRHHMCGRRSPGGSRLPPPRETSPSP